MFLPSAPSAAELACACPRIAPVPAHIERPFWSVMIPTYNCGEYLRRAITSVLVQMQGLENIQIEVLDDCSTTDDPESVVRELGQSSVAFFRQPKNCGAINTFNTCLERARGNWVHILHGDDMVLPGFYKEYERLIAANPDAVMIVGRVVIIDESDRWLYLSGPLPDKPDGTIENFVSRQAVMQLGQFAGVVVRRDCYEKVGGFCTLLSHTADWDMWFRIGRLGRVLGTERPWALYRVHQASDTSKQRISGNNIAESYYVIRANLERLDGSPVACDWRTRLADQAQIAAWDLDAKGFPEGRLNQMRWALMLRPTVRRFYWYLKSYAKVKMRQRFSRI